MYLSKGHALFKETCNQTAFGKHDGYKLMAADDWKLNKYVHLDNWNRILSHAWLLDAATILSLLGKFKQQIRPPGLVLTGL